jgi:hypothetical protein
MATEITVHPREKWLVALPWNRYYAVATLPNGQTVKVYRGTAAAARAELEATLPSHVAKAEAYSALKAAGTPSNEAWNLVYGE